MSPEEIQRKAADLKVKMQRQFVFAPMHGIQVLELVEELAARLSEHARGAGHDSMGGEG